MGITAACFSAIDAISLLIWTLWQMGWDKKQQNCHKVRRLLHFLRCSAGRASPDGEIMWSYVIMSEPAVLHVSTEVLLDAQTHTLVPASKRLITQAQTQQPRPCGPICTSDLHTIRDGKQSQICMYGYLNPLSSSLESRSPSTTLPSVMGNTLCKKFTTGLFGSSMIKQGPAVQTAPPLATPMILCPWLKTFTRLVTWNSCCWKPLLRTCSWNCLHGTFHFETLGLELLTKVFQHVCLQPCTRTS